MVGWPRGEALGRNPSHGGSNPSPTFAERREEKTMDSTDTFDHDDIMDIMHAEEGIDLGLTIIDLSDVAEDELAIMGEPERGHFYTDGFLPALADDVTPIAVDIDALFYLASDGEVFSIDDNTGTFAPARMPSFVEAVDPDLGDAPFDEDDARRIDHQLAAREAIESTLTHFAALVGSKADASWSAVIAVAPSLPALTRAIAAHAEANGLNPLDVLTSTKIVQATRRFASAYALTPEVAHAFIVLPGDVEAVDLTAEAIERW